MHKRTQSTQPQTWLILGLVLLITFLIGNYPVNAEVNDVAEFSTSTLTVDKSSVKTDQTLTYTLAIINSGADTTTDVTVVNTLPTDMTYVEAANSLKPEDNGSLGVVTNSITISGGVLTWEGSIAAGKTATFTFSSVVESTTIGETLTSTTEITHTSGNKSLTASSTVVDAAPDISTSTFEASKSSAKSGDTVSYDLAIKNTGDAGEVDVSIELPDGVTYVANSLDAPSAFGVISNPPAYANGTVTWSIIQIGFNAEAMLSFDVTVDDGVALETEIDVTAHVDGGTSVEDITATFAVVEFTNSTIYLPIVYKPFAAPVLSSTDVTNNSSGSTWTLSWTSSFSGSGEEYLIEEATDEDFTENVVTISKTTRSHRVTKPSSASSTYYYRVRLLTPPGSAYSNVIEIELQSGLTIDDTTINKDNDECTTLRWDFTGIKAFYINYAEGFDANAAAGTDSVEVCPSTDTTYTAIVVNQDDSVEEFSVSVDVSGSGCNRDPYVTRFEPTSYEVTSGTKITFYWSFECASEGRYYIGEGGPFGASSPDSREFTVTGETLFKLHVIKRVDGDEIFDGEDLNASFTVTIK